MQTIEKHDLFKLLRDISRRGWIESVKNLSVNSRGRLSRNDGAVGNILEFLVGVKENNLRIANTKEWELKTKRSGSNSLITLFHSEPTPGVVGIVERHLLLHYGWPLVDHPNELSFRATVGSKNFTSRGFKVIIDRGSRKVIFSFNGKKVKISKHREWYKKIKREHRLGELDPAVFWNFSDLEIIIRRKLNNVLYIIADSKIEDGKEFFCFTR